MGRTRGRKDGGNTTTKGSAMSVDSSKAKPIVEMTEHWSSPLAETAAIEAIAKAFSDRGVKVDQNEDGVRIRTGSNWRYRLLGNLLANRASIPVALHVTMTPAGEGSTLRAHAFDTFGWRITNRTFFGAKESVQQRLEELLKSAAAAAKVVDRSEHRA